MIWMMPKSIDELTNQINAEQQCPTARIDEGDGAAFGEHGNQSENHEQQHQHKQNAAHHREVPFGLESEDSQSETHGRGYSDGEQYLKIITKSMNS